MVMFCLFLLMVSAAALVGSIIFAQIARFERDQARIEKTYAEAVLKSARELEGNAKAFYEKGREERAKSDGIWRELRNQITRAIRELPSEQTENDTTD